ncbi:MAG: M16 family metallopeptidase, partial [Verrucomicrobiia bacterium]
LLVCVGLAAPMGAFAASLNIEFEEYDLPNGMHVILHQNSDAPVVSSYVLYHVGSKDERPDRTGFAHFFEHLMFEGSENIERKQIDKLISGAGGNLNASTSFDRTDYYINLPANELELALWIESERLMHAVIDETGVETQREVVKEERRSRYDNQPYGSIMENMAKAVFNGTPYGWTPIGSAQYIDDATIEEFRNFYKKWYVPNNATLAISGDIDVEQTKRLVERYFGEIPRGAEPKRVEVEWDLDAPVTTKVVEEPMTPLPATVHIWRAPILTDEDAEAVDLLINILAMGKSSRLYRRLVDTERAAVNAAAFTWLQEKAGLVAAYAIGNRGVSIEQLDALVEEEVQRLIDEGVTSEELQKALNQKEAEIASSVGTMSSRAESLAYYHLWYGDAGRANNELEAYLKVTQEDLQRVAKKYLVKERRNTLHYPVPSK